MSKEKQNDKKEDVVDGVATKKYKLPKSGKEIEIKTDLKAGTIMDIQEGGFQNMNKKLIKELVVEIDGKDGDVYKQVRELSYPDWKAVDRKINELMDAKEGLEEI